MSMTDPVNPSPRGQPAAGRTLTALFDTRAAAQTAIDDLVAAGVPRGTIKLIEQGAEPAAEDAAPSEHKGFWATLKDLFLPDSDRHGYEEGLRRGGLLLAVSDDGALHQRILDILDREGTVDMDQREAGWRTEGWNPERAGRDFASGAIPLGTAAAVAGGARDAPEAVPEEDLRDAYRGGPTTPVSADPEAIPADEATPGRVGRRDPETKRARVRSYLDEGL